MAEVDRSYLARIEEGLSALLGPKLSQLVPLLNDDTTFLVRIPEGADLDLPLEELASLVARTANTYGRIAYFAGVARAEAKLAKGVFDRKWKKYRGQGGKNEAERDSYAMEACADEHAAAVTADAVAEFADALEGAARISSESARKLLDKATNMDTAQRREAVGRVRDTDFETW